MQLTAEQKQIGRQNFQSAVGVSRRDFLKTAAVVPGLGALYFGYEALKGDRVRVGFIGTGKEGGVLLTEHPQDYMDVVAIADLRPTNRLYAMNGEGNEHRVGLINKLGAEKASTIKVYEDHRQLLEDPDIEAVVIAVPLAQHAPVAIDAMNAGKHVLSEKLMAHDITECKEMLRVARETNRLLAIGHQRHYNVLYENANFLVKQGVLGDIKFIRAQWHRNNSFPGRDSWLNEIPKDDEKALESRVSEFGYDDMNQLVNWRLYKETGGGLMAELGSHQMDACSIFLGKVHPIAVQGYGGKNFYGVKGVGTPDKQKDGREIDDHIYVTFEFPGPHYDQDKNDIVIVTYASINTNRLEPYGETVFGSRGTLVMNLEQETLLFKEGSPDTGPGGVDQRLYLIEGKDGSAVMDASESLAPAAALAATGMSEKVSRGYREEMEHFCHTIRTLDPEKYGDPESTGLRCHGKVAMADAIMALTANLAMKHKKRIVFKPDWFDPDSPAVPETDPDVVG